MQRPVPCFLLVATVGIGRSERVKVDRVQKGLAHVGGFFFFLFPSGESFWVSTGTR